ncbi:aminotransferase class V-fold PLP-dependent enzyme [Angustibacter sp. McL0619]|uniref:aminotransferase class V-fold PLP-dependent enzyme n=1 Tax=Angustibacter sp. McL0619 TaxID=3415676 RepID=UPI003CEC89C6
MLPVVGADLQVPVVTGGTVRYANLDYAASAPALESVEEHLSQVLPYYASVHRGAGYASQVSTALLERARATVGRFLGARAGDVVVFTRNTTDALNLLAGCLPQWGDVVFLDAEHHANLLPWQRGEHRYVPVRGSLDATLQSLESALRERPAALVAITGASNVTGEELPIERVVAIAHRHGARVVVDAAQLAPHRRIDLDATGVDYVALSGHKLYAPYGTGVLVGRRDWLDRGTPYLAGGGAVRSVELERTEWACAPQRHEGGTPNMLGAAALAASCEALAALPEAALEVHEAALRERLVHGLAQLPGVRVHRIFDDAPSSIGVVTFTVDGVDPGLVAAYLSAEHGIGVRDGKFCAHPLLARLGLDAGAVRASVGVGSQTDDVDRLVAALASLIETGPAWQYASVEGRWTPTPDPRPLPRWATGAGDLGASPCTPEAR